MSGKKSKKNAGVLKNGFLTRMANKLIKKVVLPVKSMKNLGFFGKKISANQFDLKISENLIKQKIIFNKKLKKLNWKNQQEPKNFFFSVFL